MEALLHFLTCLLILTATPAAVDEQGPSPHLLLQEAVVSAALPISALPARSHAEDTRTAATDDADLRWQALGPGLNGPVLAVVFGPDGSLYAGGQFTAAGEQPLNKVARWDGTAWHPLGNGITNAIGYAYVSSLVIGPDGALYAGGQFSDAGGVPALNVARWDDENWNAVGGGLSVDGVDNLAFGADGALYAVAAFGSLLNGGLWAWSGEEWHRIGWPYERWSVSRALLADPGGDVYVADAWEGRPPAWRSTVLAWKGHYRSREDTWEVVGNYIPININGFAFGDDGVLYATGGRRDFNPIKGIWRWGRGEWEPLIDGPDRGVESLIVGPDGALYAGGDFNAVGGGAASGLARGSDGGRWEPIGSGVSGVVLALAFGPGGELVVAGNFHDAGGFAASNIATASGLPVSTDPGTAVHAQNLPAAPDRDPGSKAETQSLLAAPYPNPASGGITIDYEVNEPGYARITLHDVLGRVVWVSTEAEQSAGSHTMEISLAGLAPGSYVLHLEVNGRVADSQRLTVVR